MTSSQFSEFYVNTAMSTARFSYQNTELRREAWPSSNVARPNLYSLKDLSSLHSCPWSLKLMTFFWVLSNFVILGVRSTEPELTCFFPFSLLCLGDYYIQVAFINLAYHADFPWGSSRVVEDCMTSQKSVCMGGCYKLLSDFLLIFAFRQDEENSAEREQTMLFKIKET